MDWCIVTIFLVSLALVRNIHAQHHALNISVNTEQYIHETDPEFLSIALDSALIRRRWEGFDFGSDKIGNLARGLFPAFLRIGGTDEDFLLFDEETKSDQKPHSENNTKCASDTRGYTNFTMTTGDVDKIFHFSQTTGLMVIFGLNVLLRRGSPPRSHWDSTNAQKLMRYIAGKGFVCRWELGNEPVDLKGLVNRTITGARLAEDFRILRGLLDAHPEYGNFLVGPDVSSPWKGETRQAFLKEFLANMKGSIDAMTYHQYYTNNKASVADFHDPKILDLLIKEINEIQNIITTSGAVVARWLGETSSAYGGGVPAVSDSFVAGFMWLDKLGVAARLKHNVIIRQTFYGGSYSLISRKSFDPFPDYWSSLLYKRLVGQRVLEVRDGIELDRKIRIYAHCTSKKSTYATGSIVFIALNTQGSEVQLVFVNGLQDLSVDQYLLTPGVGRNLTSQTVKLNGVPLKLVNDTFLPDIHPKRIVPLESKILLPALSYGFYVIPGANAKGCDQAELDGEKPNMNYLGKQFPKIKV